MKYALESRQRGEKAHAVDCTPFRAHADICPGSCKITTPAAPRELMSLRAFCTAKWPVILRGRKHIVEETYATLTQAWGVNTGEGGSRREKADK